jgi:hypothetical protein
MYFDPWWGESSTSVKSFIFLLTFPPNADRTASESLLIVSGWIVNNLYHSDPNILLEREPSANQNGYGMAGK